MGPLHSVQDFFVPVIFTQSDKSSKHRITEVFDDYFYLVGKKKEVSEVEGKLFYHLADPRLSKSEKYLLGTVKFISYFTGLIPLVMLVGKAILRKNLFLMPDNQVESKKELPVSKSPLSPPSKTSETQSVTRAAFENKGSYSCFANATIQCLSSVIDLLPRPEELVQNEEESDQNFEKRKEDARYILPILEKTQQAGKIITQAEITGILSKIYGGCEEPDDSKAFMRSLLEVFNLSYIHLTSSTKKKYTTPHPINLHERNEELVIKKEGVFQIAFDMEVVQTKAAVNFLIFNREELPEDPKERIEKEIPLTLQIGNSTQTTLTLVAVSISRGGHATAYAKDDKGWQYLDDMHLSRVSSEEAIKDIKKNGMVLVYK